MGRVKCHEGKDHRFIYLTVFRKDSWKFSFKYFISKIRYIEEEAIFSGLIGGSAQKLKKNK